MDGDGTEIMPNLTQYYKIGESKLPPPGTSNSNILHVKFHTNGDNYDRRTGWRLEWSEVDGKNDNSLLIKIKLFKMEVLISN